MSDVIFDKYCIRVKLSFERVTDVEGVLMTNAEFNWRLLENWHSPVKILFADNETSVKLFIWDCKSLVADFAKLIALSNCAFVKLPFIFPLKETLVKDVLSEIVVVGVGVA